MRSNPSRVPARRNLVAALLPPLALSFAACSSASAGRVAPSHVDAAPIACDLPPGPVAVAAAARSNSATPKVTAKIQTVIEHAIDSQSHVSVFDTDGAPTLIDEGTLSLEAQNDQAAARERDLLERKVATAVAESKADEAEADPLVSLDTAARTVHGRGRTGTVVMVDSGLQTSGALRYQSSDLLLASGSDVVAHLRTTGQLPDLSGITVVLAGLGDTVAPQPRLDAATRNRLVEQWTAVAEAAGASCVEVDTEPLTGAAAEGLPEVAVVEATEPPQLALDVQQPLALREDTVGFEDNSDALRDPAAAKAALTTVAGEIGDGGYDVALVGTTATAGTEAGRRALSLARAEAVKRLLIELGVPAERIITKGVGTNHPQHVPDLDADGAPIAEAAVQNRAVFVSVSR